MNYKIIEKDGVRYAIGEGDACKEVYIPGMTWDIWYTEEAAEDYLIRDGVIYDSPTWIEAWYVIRLGEAQLKNELYNEMLEMLKDVLYYFTKEDSPNEAVLPDVIKKIKGVIAKAEGKSNEQ